MQILDTKAQLVIAEKLRWLHAHGYFGSWYGRTDVDGLNGQREGEGNSKQSERLKSNKLTLCQTSGYKLGCGAQLLLCCGNGGLQFGKISEVMEAVR